MLRLRILSAIQRSRAEFLTRWKIILWVGNMLNINICYDERSLETWRFSEVLEAHWSMNLSSKMTLLYMILSFLNVLKWFSCSSDLIICKDKKHRNAQILTFIFYVQSSYSCNWVRMLAFTPILGKTTVIKLELMGSNSDK